MMEEGRWCEFLEWLDASGLMEEKVGAPAAQLRQKDRCVRARCGVVERVWPAGQDGAPAVQCYHRCLFTHIGTLLMSLALQGPVPRGACRATRCLQTHSCRAHCLLAI